MHFARILVGSLCLLSPALGLAQELFQNKPAGRTQRNLAAWDLALSDPLAPVVLNLKPGASYRLTDRQTSASADGSALILSGRLDGQPGSSAVLAASEDGFFALISDGSGRRFQITQEAAAQGGGLTVTEVEENVLGDAHFDVPEGLEQAEPGIEESTDDGSVIDVLLLWTPAVESRQGGAAQMRLKVNALQEEINLGLRNSGIQTQVRFVSPQMIQFTTPTTGLATTLVQLANKRDGVLDQVHALRDSVRADLVSLLTVQTDLCGAGYLMRPSTVTGDYAFTVVNDGCAFSNFTLAHEIGHNMGAHHDRASASGGAGAYSYSFGWVTPSNPGFSDIMSYAPAGRPRRNHWANPDLRINGMAAGARIGAADEADLRTTLNQMRVPIARIRASASAAPAGSSGSGASGGGTGGAGAGSGTQVTSVRFGQPGDVVITGDWNGSGVRSVGVYRPSTGQFLLDVNQNLTWDPTADRTVNAGGAASDIPFVFTDPGARRDRPALFRGGLVLVP